MIRRAPTWAIVAAAIAVGASSIACGGKTEGGTGDARDPGIDGGGDALSDETLPTPRPPSVHRPSASSCPTTRPPGDPGGVTPSSDSGTACTRDDECTAGTNGRCNTPHCDCVGGGRCTYDECFDDSACGVGGVCACRGTYTVTGMSTDEVPNVCTHGNCVVDADCGDGGFCSPSYDSSCGNKLVGWFCHTKGDTCIDDASCGVHTSWGGGCEYDATAGRWACVLSCGAG